jgi:hypothetical protein
MVGAKDVVLESPDRNLLDVRIHTRQGRSLDAYALAKQVL